MSSFQQHVQLFSRKKKYHTFHWAFFPFSQLPCHEVRIFSRLIRFWGRDGREGSWAHAQYSSMLPVGFTWIRYLDSFYRSWDLGTKGIIQRIQRTFPVVRMMKMCWVPKAWYISRSSYKLYIQAALLSDMLQCHHHSLGILGLNQPYGPMSSGIKIPKSPATFHPLLQQDHVLLLPSWPTVGSRAVAAMYVLQFLWKVGIFWRNYSIASNSLMSLDRSCHCQVLLPSKAHQASTMFPRTASRFSNCSSYLFCTLLCLSNLIPNPKSSCKMEFLRFQAQIPSMDWWCHSNWQRKSTAYGHRHPHTIQMENKKLDARVLPQRTKTRIPLSKWRGFLLIAIIVCPSWFSKAH